jgi:kinesin family protein 18/19
VVCSCGHIDEKEEMRSIKEQIFENFNERIQLRRAMMEIEEQNAMNILEIKKKQGELTLLKKADNWETQEGESAKDIAKLINTLKQNTNKNNLKKEITNLQIMESMSNTKKIRDDIVKKIRSKENREVLGTSSITQRSSSRTTCCSCRTSNSKSTCKSRRG